MPISTSPMIDNISNESGDPTNMPTEDPIVSEAKLGSSSSTVADRFVQQDQQQQPFIMQSAASSYPPQQPQPPYYSYNHPFASAPPMFQPPPFTNTSSYWNPYAPNAIYPPPPPPPTSAAAPAYPDIWRDTPIPDPPNPIVPLSIGAAIALVGMATIRWLNGEDFSLFPMIHSISTLSSTSTKPLLEDTSTSSTNTILPQESDISSFQNTQPSHSSSTTALLFNDKSHVLQPIQELTTAIQKLTLVHEKFIKASSDATGKALTDDVMGLLMKKKKTTMTTTTGPKESTTSSTTASSTFPYSWFLLQQIVKVKTHVDSIKVAIQRIEEGGGDATRSDGFDLDIQAESSTMNHPKEEDATMKKKNMIQDEIRKLMEKVHSITSAMVQMERVLAGQDIPKAATDEIMEVEQRVS